MVTMPPGPADITNTVARYQDALALAARLRLLDGARVAPRPSYVARVGAWLRVRVVLMRPMPPVMRVRVGGER